MDLNLNVTFGITPELKECVTELVAAIRPLRVSLDSERSVSENAAPAAPEAPEAPAAPTPEKKTRTRRAKAGEMQTEAPATPEEAMNFNGTNAEDAIRPAEPEKEETAAPAGEESADNSTSDLPFASETDESKPAARREMGLKEWKLVLQGVRLRLMLEDNQKNFEKKKDFNKLCCDIAKYYGASKPSELTPANLYYCAAQIAKIELVDGEFVAPDPIISPAQVEEFKQAPFNK